MSQIKVQFSLLKDINLIISTSSKNILEAKDDFKNAISKLDWEVKAQSDISVRAASVVGELRCYNTALNWYSNYLDMAYAKYSALENYEQGLENVGDVTVFSPESEAAIFTEVTKEKNSNAEIEQPKTQLGVLGYIIGALENGLKWFVNNLDTLIHWVNKKVSKISQKVENEKIAFIADIVGLGTALYDTLKESIKNGFGVMETISLAFHDVFNFVTGKIDEIMKNGDENDRHLGIFKKISSILEEIQKTIDRFKQDIADAITELGGLIKSLGSFLGEIPGINKAVLYPVCGVLTMASSIAGNVMTFKDNDGVLEGNEILQAVGKGLLDGLGTIGSLFLEDYVDNM